MLFSLLKENKYHNESNYEFVLCACVRMDSINLCLVKIVAGILEAAVDIEKFEKYEDLHFYLLYKIKWNEI